MLEAQIFKNELIDERFDFKYDFASRRAAVKGTVKKNLSKLETALDSNKGLDGIEFKITQDFENKYFKSLALGYGRSGGATAKANLQIGKANKFSASTDIKNKKIDLEYTLKPQQI